MSDITIPAMALNQMRNISRYNEQRLREAKRDIEKGRVDEVVYTTLDLAITWLSELSKIGPKGEDE